MIISKSTLQIYISLSPKARFQSRKAVHVNLDGGLQYRHGMGEVFILDADRKEVMRARRYSGAGLTNNKVESFALWDALDCFTK